MATPITVPTDPNDWRVPNRNVVVEPPTLEPLTLDEAKLRAGLDWPAGDPRDAQMTDFIRAARERVERDTGLALLTQTRDVYLSHIVPMHEWPAPAFPLQSILTITVPEIATMPTGVVLTPTDFAVRPNGQIVIHPNPLAPPLNNDPQDEWPWVVRIVVGWETVAEIPPLLRFAVGLLCAHYATTARDAVVTGTIATVIPLGYEDAIADFRRVSV